MAELTAQALRALLVEVAGDDEGIAEGPGFADVPFDDLGFDSLALMELAARIGREHGVEVDDDQLAELTTPRALLDLVNGVPADAP